VSQNTMKLYEDNG